MRKVRSKQDHSMKNDKILLRPLLIGVGPRLVIATIIATLLWLGFAWATASLGAL